MYYLGVFRTLSIIYDGTNLKDLLMLKAVNPLVLNARFLYPLKTSENFTVF